MRSQISAYETRNFHDISIPKQNLEFSKRSFHYSAAKLWNEIPLQIRNNSSIFAFKRTLKEYLLHQQFPKSTVSRKSSIYFKVKRSTIVIDDLINDSTPYCACVILKISDDFYDDRHENRLVEIRL